MTGSRPQGDITVWSVAVTNSPPGDADLMNAESPKNENKCDNDERPDVTSLSGIIIRVLRAVLAKQFPKCLRERDFVSSGRWLISVNISQLHAVNFSLLQFLMFLIKQSFSN